MTLELILGTIVFLLVGVLIWISKRKKPEIYVDGEYTQWEKIDDTTLKRLSTWDENNLDEIGVMEINDEESEIHRQAHKAEEERIKEEQLKHSKFLDTLDKGSIDLDPEFSKIVDDNFHELIEKSEEERIDNDIIDKIQELTGSKIVKKKRGFSNFSGRK